jgi:hypothetical protein
MVYAGLMMNKHTLITIFLAIILSAVGFNLGIQVLREFTESEASRIEKTWATDLKNLRQKPDLEKILSGVSQLNVEPALNDAVAKDWIEKMKLPIAVNPTGSFAADILVISDIEDKVKAVTIQMSFVDLQSGNLVAEIARRYEF